MYLIYEVCGVCIYREHSIGCSEILIYVNIRCLTYYIKWMCYLWGGVLFSWKLYIQKLGFYVSVMRKKKTRWMWIMSQFRIQKDI